jgi:hypothetical protein
MDSSNRHPLLNVLIEGGGRATAVLPQLYGLAHRGQFRDEIADLVLNQISAVQGSNSPESPSTIATNARCPHV